MGVYENFEVERRSSNSESSDFWLTRSPSHFLSPFYKAIETRILRITVLRTCYCCPRPINNSFSGLHYDHTAFFLHADARVGHHSDLLSLCSCTCSFGPCSIRSKAHNNRCDIGIRGRDPCSRHAPERSHRTVLSASNISGFRSRGRRVKCCV